MHQCRGKMEAPLYQHTYINIKYYYYKSVMKTELNNDMMTSCKASDLWQNMVLCFYGY